VAVLAGQETITGPPDFIGVGTQRSGTTWWFRTLLDHPGIRAPRKGRKELHFFDRFGAEPLADADIAAYHALFPRKPGQLAGEWTPRYMLDFWTPPLLRRAAPEAKLLVMFRDPIERFRSGVPHRQSRSESARIQTVTADAVERGRYASQLERLRASHPDAEILVLQYEKCVADPVTQYKRTLRFLGADDSHEPVASDRPRGTSQASSKRELWPDLVAGLKATLEPEVVRLAATEPEIDLSLWRNFAHLATTPSHDAVGA
jgi:sulfotransferase family protein